VSTRSPEEAALRQSRADIYRKLRKENIAVTECRSIKKRKGGDGLDDLLGGSDDFTSSPSSGPRTRVSNMIKQVKARQPPSGLRRSRRTTRVKSWSRSGRSTLRSSSPKLSTISCLRSYQGSISSRLFQLYLDFLAMLKPKVMTEISNPDVSPPRRCILLCVSADLMIVHAIDPILRSRSARDFTCCSALEPARQVPADRDAADGFEHFEREI
jgi:hypothetical protein